MRTTTLALCLSLALFGCPKKKTEAPDAASDAQAAAPVDSGPAGPEAANVSEIARFGDETKIEHEVAKTEAPITFVRKAPPNGDILARLPHGVEVTKLASHEGQFLVTFNNPKKADERLMGWISAGAFKPAPPIAQKCKSDKDCGAGHVCIPHETGTKCEKACSGVTTAACPENTACKGEGPNAEGKVVQYCVSTLPPDAGAPKAADAGTSAADAGKPKKDGGK